MRQVISDAIHELCVAFERHGYNPTPVIDLGVLVANADGAIDVHERAMLREIFQTLLDTRLTPEVVDHLVTASVEVIELAGTESRARLIAAILVDCEAVEPGIKVALGLAFASRGLSKAEVAVIERMARLGHLSAVRLAAITAEIRSFADAAPVSVRQSLMPPAPS